MIQEIAGGCQGYNPGCDGNDFVGIRQIDHDYGCGRQTIGMAYVPDQKWQKIYKISHGFYRGTIFAELEKPWRGRRDCHE